jgi:hypothetical protein
MRNELEQSVDHFRRAASLAAQETGATVGPKLVAAKVRVQPTAAKARDAAASGWGTALTALSPLLAATSASTRQTSKAGRKQARKLERRVNKALGRKQPRHTGAKLGGLLVAGAAVGAASAYALRRQRRAQWDEYAPGTTPAPLEGVDDAAFEPDGLSGATGAAAPIDEVAPAGTLDPVLEAEAGDQTSSPQHSPTVARMAGGQSKR